MDIDREEVAPSSWREELAFLDNFLVDDLYEEDEDEVDTDFEERIDGEARYEEEFEDCLSFAEREEEDEEEFS